VCVYINENWGVNCLYGGSSGVREKPGGEVVRVIGVGLLSGILSRVRESGRFQGKRFVLKASGAEPRPPRSQNQEPPKNLAERPKSLKRRRSEGGGVMVRVGVDVSKKGERRRIRAR
jgi:hypothetical protein